MVRVVSSAARPNPVYADSIYVASPFKHYFRGAGKDRTHFAHRIIGTVVGSPVPVQHPEKDDIPTTHTETRVTCMVFLMARNNRSSRRAPNEAGPRNKYAPSAPRTYFVREMGLAANRNYLPLDKMLFKRPRSNPVS